MLELLKKIVLSLRHKAIVELQMVFLYVVDKPLTCLPPHSPPDYLGQTLSLPVYCLGKDFWDLQMEFGKKLEEVRFAPADHAVPCTPQRARPGSGGQ